MTPGPIELEVGRPGLVVLIGAAGVGKTTLAARLFAADDVVSSDELRAAVSGDAADQRATRRAFAILHREVARRLAANRFVVVDATSVERASRRALLTLAAAARVPAVALLLALPAELVRARNGSRRGRPVPPDVVERHLARVAHLTSGGSAAAVDALLGEGFGRAIVVRSDDEVARLRIVRGPPVSRR
jgi:protein phosphatase